MSISLPISSGTIGNIAQLTVDARTLHEVLEVKRDFSTWIKGRISKYSFKENEDFIVFTKSGENPLGGRSSLEYRLSVNMGKELAMVENNERGRMVRRYFIECERKLMETPAPAIPSLTIEDRRPLSNLIGQWAGKAKLSFPDCWRELHAVFNISTVAELPASQLPAALAWVQAKIDALSPSVPSNVPTMSPSVPTELAAYGLRKNFWKELEDARAKLGSISSAIDITLPQSRSLGDRQNAVLCDTLSSNVQVAHNCLVVAQQALKAALSLKKELVIA